MDHTPRELDRIGLGGWPVFQKLPMSLQYTAKAENHWIKENQIHEPVLKKITERWIPDNKEMNQKKEFKNEEAGLK